MRGVILLLVFAHTSFALSAQDGPCGLAGRYDLTITAGTRAIPARLEMTCLQARHWGRLAVALGDPIVGAMLQAAVRGDTVDLRMGGAFAGFTLTSAGDSVHGQVMLGGERAFPYAGVRQSSAADPSLMAHAALRPWNVVAVHEDSGQSYPVLIDSSTIVFTRHGRGLRQQRLLVANRSGTRWTVRPLTTPADAAASERGPSLLPGGRGLMFASTRRTEGDTAVSPRFRLWTIERSGSGWGPPSPATRAAGLAGDGAQQPSVTATGAVYFTSDRPGGLGGRDVYRLEPGADTPVPLGAPVSGPGDEHGAWISPEGDLLIISSGGGRAESHGGDDLYWSVRTGAGWSQPRLLPVPVNSFGNEYGASLSPDRRTLWFTSDRFGIARLYRVTLADHGVTLPAAP